MKIYNGLNYIPEKIGYTQLVEKDEVHEHIARTIESEYLMPLLGPY